jgi:hypothetical protein
MTDLLAPEEFPSYDGLLSQSADQILKHAFNHAQNLTVGAGKYLALRELMMALIVLTAQRDKKNGK